MEAAGLLQQAAGFSDAPPFLLAAAVLCAVPASEEKYGSFSFGGGGSALPDPLLSTPQRGMSGFDAHLGARNPFAATAELQLSGGGSGSGGPFTAFGERSGSTSFGERSGSSFGERSNSSFGGSSFGTSSSGAGGLTKPRSLMDATKAARAAAQEQSQAPSQFSPPQANTRALRSSSNAGGMFSGGPSAGIPSQSLRDSPFMRAPPAADAAPRNVLATPAAAASTAASAAARTSTPFDTEASPVRPGAFTAAVHAAATAAKPAAASSKQNERAEEDDGQQEERKYQDSSNSVKHDTKRALFSSPAGTAALVPVSHSAAALLDDDTSWPYGGAGNFSAPAPVASASGLGYSAAVDPCAVTVWGFGAADTRAVLQRFAAFGDIVAREDGAADLGGGEDSSSSAAATSCNWLHLRYRTTLAASMALAHNGRTVVGARGRVLMLGVRPRIRALDQACDGVAGLSSSSSAHGPHDRHVEGGLFERLARKQQQTQASQRQSAAATSASGLTASTIYAGSQGTQPAALRKSFCTRLLEALFNY